jgi:AbrB family looped-hinge helix DNA binding protein
MEAAMTAVTISPKFQVVIPKEIRNALQLKVGQKVEVVPYNGRIELVPVESPKALRGLLRHIDKTFERDEADRV